MRRRLENALVGMINYHIVLFTKSSFEDILSSTSLNISAESKAITNARRLYTSCVNETTIELDGVDVILSFINKELGGWPILLGSMWKESTFDLLHLMTRLSQHNNFIFYKVKSVADEKNSSIRSIRVRVYIRIIKSLIVIY